MFHGLNTRNIKHHLKIYIYILIIIIIKGSNNDYRTRDCNKKKNQQYTEQS
jgi:hypothetical protein